jgi:hypothetical protein
VAKYWKVKTLAAAVAVPLLTVAASASPVDLTYQGPSANDPKGVTITSTPTGVVPAIPNPGAFGFNMTSSADPLTSFLAWCLDIASLLGTGSAYEYEITSSPFSNSEGLDSGQMDRVQDVFDANYTTLDATDGVQAAGFQVALWNALYDTDADAGSGEFSVSAGSGIINQSNIFLANADSYSGNKAFNLTFYESTGVGSAKKQNLVSATPVPLPAAGLLFIGALGGLAALRRRKNAA